MRQNHDAYARDQFGWDPGRASRPTPPFDAEKIWNLAEEFGDYYHPFARAGRRVTRRDLEPDDWHAWKSDLARVLRGSAAYFYAQFVRGSRRVVVDGIEPTERFAESIQFEFFEYLYQQVLRKEDEWAAREVFREQYRANAAQVLAHRYDHQATGCLYLYTTPHILLDDLMAQPIGEGDIFSNANTIILMGRTREAGRMGRALYVAKHRGSAAADEIQPVPPDRWRARAWMTVSNRAETSCSQGSPTWNAGLVRPSSRRRFPSRSTFKPFESLTTVGARGGRFVLARRGGTGCQSSQPPTSVYRWLWRTSGAGRSFARPRWWSPGMARPVPAGSRSR